MTQARELGNVGDSLNTSEVVTTGDVGTVTQGMLATGLAGTGPAFYARQATDQSPTNGTNTRVTLATEVFDTNNNFATNRFTPTVAGYYIISGGVRGSSASSDITNVHAAIYKNGTAYQRSIMQTETGVGAFTPTITTIVSMNGTTDYVELYGLVTSTAGTGQIFDYASADSCAFFCGCLIKAL